MDHEKKGSINRDKQRLKVAKLHEKIENQRNDFLHKLSNNYINNYDLIAIEDLQIQKMIKNNKLSRHINDASWNKFMQMLVYKAERAGVQVIKVNPRVTTQECSNCNKIVKKGLNDRIHNCDCGLHVNRDYNFALKILKKATGILLRKEFTEKATVGRTGSNALIESFYEKASGKNETYSGSMNKESRVFKT